MLRSWCGLLSLLAVALLTSAAQAGMPSHVNTLNRWLGLGWSEGYHARNGCGTNTGWVTPHATPPDAEEVSTTPPELAEPGPTPAKRPLTTVRTSQMPKTGEPTLPSQKFSPRPAYWYR
jgi:hypothetical protein